MPYSSPSLGSLARNVGKNCRQMATASRRARVTAACWEAGRIGKIAATVSSFASVRDATCRKASARFEGLRCAEAKYASIATRMRINSGEGCGRSSAADRSWKSGWVTTFSGRSANERNLNEAAYCRNVADGPTQSGAFKSACVTYPTFEARDHREQGVFGARCVRVETKASYRDRSQDRLP